MSKTPRRILTGKKKKRSVTSGTLPAGTGVDWFSISKLPVERLLDGLPVAAYLTDKNGYITQFNKSAVKLWGRTPELFKEQWCGSHQLFDSNNVPIKHSECPMAMAIKSKRSIEGAEAILARPNGRRISFMAYATPFKNKRGGLEGAMNVMVDVSARKKKEDRLKQRENKNRRIEESLRKSQAIANVGSWQMQGEDEIYWSDEFYRIHGLLPQSVTPSTERRLSMVHPDDRKKLHKAIESAVRAGKPYALEKRIILPTGELRWVLSQGEAAIDPITKKQRVFGTLIDITERKRAEDLIVQSNARLSETLVFGKMGSAELNLVTSRVIISRELMHLLDVEVSDAQEFSLDHFIRTYVEPSQASLIQRKISEGMEGSADHKKIVGVEFQMISATGRKIWIDGKGIFKGDSALGILHDITDKRESQLQLERSEERFRLLYNNTPVMMHSIDRSGCFLRVSDYWLQKMEYTRDEVIGRNVYDFVSDNSRETFEKFFPVFLSTGTISNVEIELVTKSGNVLSTILSASSERDDDGIVTKSLSVVTDISEKKKLEQEVERLALVASYTTNSVVMTDNQARITWVNKGFEDITNFTLEEVVGRRALDFLRSTGTSQEVIQRIRDGAYRGKIFRIEVPVFDKSGKEYWMDSEVIPLQTKAGKPMGFISVQTNITMLKRVVYEMLNSQTHLQSMMNNAPLAVFIKDTQGRYRYFNDKFEQAVLPIAVKIGSTDFDFLDTQTANDFHESDKRILKAGVTESFEYSINNRDYLTIKFPIRDHEGNINALGGMAMDTSERRQMQTKLGEMEGRFRTMADAAPVLIWMAGTDTLCTYFNKGWLEFTGRALEQELGNGWAEGVHADDFHRCLDIYLTHFGKRTEFKMEYRLRRADGQYRWIVDYGIPRYLPNGEFDGYIGSAIDIHDMVEAKQKLQEREERLRAIIQTEPNCVKVLNEKGELIDMNTSGLAMIEADSLEQVAYQQVVNIVDEPYRDRFKNLTSLVFRGGSGMLRFPITGLKGTKRWLETHAVPLKNIHGNIASLLGVTRDITDQFYSEEKLKQSVLEKEALIREIHHRTKNNLQLISSILYLKVAAMGDVQVKSFLEDTRQKIRTVALVHERLLQSGSVNQVDTADYLGRLLLDLGSSHMDSTVKLQVESTIEPHVIKLDTAVYCGLIINELMINSVKHAFAERAAGIIQVSFVKREDFFQLVVGNNGAPLPVHVGIGQSSSFGMKLLDIFIRQLDAQVEIVREGGTSFRIWFKA